ncbi:MAG TPA: nuclear transport factor 2 family protein [Anaeromyxobacteraceae bacterium]|nr:nuclear transport factor 2 family protein [Anaeromyxobacteraceae bacterium]
MNRELEVLEANEAFYRSFAARDADAMDALWARRAPVACIHPGWDTLDGRAEVVGSFRAILTSGGAPQVRCSAASAHVVGEVAFVTCHELIAGARLVATNVFAREDGAWRMVHHHASPMAPAQVRARSPEPELRS